jgi:acyl carrier protein phosphodiesterase
MNFLAHAHLSGNDESLLAGNLMGDAVSVLERHYSVLQENFREFYPQLEKEAKGLIHNITAGYFGKSQKKQTKDGHQTKNK